MRLAHLHLPHQTPFARVSDIQQALTSRLLTHKKLASPGSISSQCSNPSSISKTPPPPPDPTIITFTPNPVYTTGRRDLPPSNTPPQQQPSPSPHPSSQFAPSSPATRPSITPPYARLGLTPRCHIRVLENSVIDLLASYGVKGFTTEDPGVWTGAGPKKITAVGVHLRRNISSFGIGLNVTDEPMWFFKQIVACGLEGKEATSLQGEGVSAEIDDVAAGFVKRFVARVNADFACGEGAGEKIDEVYRVKEEDLLPGLQ
ncbi:uncharacterized protein N7506_004554 [Penicillium brevicompactum]|uniref:uncharacterized protein n=1 Tax=Penicillium brevicompactum TaxID=5074 RepID=UPI00253FC936|nr:uncharacterized protein N7506_004554 [Penicillium brevicompactum]KAJ5336532.1 hypothetical protein N7506_004554 [Penicillium brevicompactum]